MTCTGVNMAPRPDVTQHLVVALNSLCGRFNRAGDRVAQPRRAQAAARASRRGASRRADLWGTGPRSRFRGLGRFGIEMPINVFADEVLTPGAGPDQARSSASAATRRSRSPISARCSRRWRRSSLRRRPRRQA